MSNPAEGYEANMVPTIFDPSAAILVETARPQPGDRVLDLACGTGIVLRHAAAHVGPTGTLTGVDLNTDMLAVARQVAETEGLTAELHEGQADALPLDDGSVDLVLCGHGLQFFPDKAAALAEMWRVLAPGGRVAIAVWQDLSRQHPFEEAFFGAIAEHLGVPLAELNPYAFGQEEELRALVADAGFESIEVDKGSFTVRYPYTDTWLEDTVKDVAPAVCTLQDLDEPAVHDLARAVAEKLEPQAQELVVGGYVEEPARLQTVHATRP